MPKVIISPTAKADLQEIKNYIALDRKQSAIAYIKLLKQKFIKLADAPKIGRADENYLGLKKFPIDSYIIFYREQNQGIEIARVLHSARDIQAILRK